ncbi:MAG TPA: peptidoglycan-binding protein [Gaiellaceae bacterium]|nr:peptidoglycan-binding protein [Gaiellaceae bacterium]
MNRRVLIPLAGLLVAAAAGATWAAAAGSGSGSDAADTADAHGPTATVERRDLVQHESVDGTLGYGDTRTLYAHAMGTVTALRKPGRVVTRGQALYWVDGKPVTLMYGDVPMWRPLNAATPGGKDIRELERNLVALGYDPDGKIDVDDDWEPATTAAVKRWQKDIGLPRTGSVEPGQIAFLPGPRRIGQLKTSVGAVLQPGAEVAETSSTSRVVAVDLDADKQALVKERDKVEVELPDGSTVNGWISSVGKVAESQTDPQTGEQGAPTVPLEISLARGVKTGGLDEAPVNVAIQKDRADNVLTVPVSALLALAEGGYAVEVVDPDGSTHLVAVEPGLYADGIVEITGNGIKKGMKVVVPG